MKDTVLRTLRTARNQRDGDIAFMVSNIKSSLNNLIQDIGKMSLLVEERNELTKSIEKENENP